MEFDLSLIRLHGQCWLQEATRQWINRNTTNLSRKNENIKNRKSKAKDYLFLQFCFVSIHFGLFNCLPVVCSFIFGCKWTIKYDHFSYDWYKTKAWYTVAFLCFRLFFFYSRQTTILALYATYCGCRQIGGHCIDEILH